VKFDQETDLFARNCPKTWEVISGRRYLLPNYRQPDYANQVHLINEYVQYLADFCSGTHDPKGGNSVEARDADLANLALGLEHKRPTYFLERELGEKLMRVFLPDPLGPELIKWRFPQMRIMLPKDLLRVDYENGRIQSLMYLDIARFDKDKKVSFPRELVRELELDPRISINRLNANKGPLEKDGFCYRKDGGIAIASRSTHPDFSSECRVYSILEAWSLIDIQKLNRSICLDEVINSVSWPVMDVRVKHLALNILLFLSSSPENFELLEPIRTPKTKGKRFISGLYPAKFVGDSQRMKIRHEPNVIAARPAGPGSPRAAHWVAGHWKHQSIGPRDSPSTKLILIYPYFAEGNKDQLNGESVATV
jgi:hypothetical protein